MSNTVLSKADDLPDLERRVREMIQSISKGESSPQTSGIGKMFNRLKSLDLQVYNRVLEEYRPVFEMDRKRRGYGRKASKPVVEDEDEVAIEAAEIQREAAETEIDVPVDDDDVIIEPEDEGDESPRKGKRGRPSKQPERTAGKVKPEPKGRKVRYIKEREEEPDRTSYTLDGVDYGKGPIVLATVKFIVKKNPKIDFDGLKKLLPDHLLPGYGVFAEHSVAMDKSKVRKRYFLNPDQIIALRCGTKIAVCNQITGQKAKIIVAAAIIAGVPIK